MLLASYLLIDGKALLFGLKNIVVEQRVYLGMHPYKYMGRYGGKEGKNDDKVRIIFDEILKTISLLDKMN